MRERKRKRVGEVFEKQLTVGYAVRTREAFPV